MISIRGTHHAFYNEQIRHEEMMAKPAQSLWQGLCCTWYCCPHFGSFDTSNNRRITSIWPSCSSSPYRYCGKNLCFFSLVICDWLIFPWWILVWLRLQWFACDFFQLNSNSAGRHSPKGTSLRAPSFENVFCSRSSLTRWLLQTSINALPIVRPDQVSVPNDQCFASEPSVCLLYTSDAADE